MISVEKLSWSFPQKDLYEDISFTIEDGRHCVLVGSNGTGKTTLTDLIADSGNYIIHHGRITKPEGCRIGYVSQYVKHNKAQDTTVYEYLCEDFLRMQAETEQICAELETAEDPDEAFARYQHSLDCFDAVDGYNYESNLHRRLKTAGLQQLEELPLSAISGGEYKLVQIIKEMLILPDLLIMDEPDAFLDFENICGLCDLINDHKGTMLVVTHNRYLLNHCFDQVLHLENMGLRSYDGSYPEYTCALLQMKADLQETARKESEWVEIQRVLVDRLRDEATMVVDPYRGKKLKARVSYLARLEKTLTKEPFLEVRELDISLPQITGQLDACSQDGEDTTCPSESACAVRAENYCLAFGDKVLLDGVSFVIGPKDKCVLVGPNGTGKSSMLRQIHRGEANGIEINPVLKADFLSQIYGETLPEQETALELFRDRFGMDRYETEAYLGRYGLDADAMKAKIGVLSGGEKNLLQLAVIGKGDADILFLDEPTSHLDLKAQLSLEKAIREYPGAVLMVSHDFYTIANCADYVLYVENGTLRKMSGRAFRKMVYKKHFSSDYLLLEQQKKDLELKIAGLLEIHDFAAAKDLCRQLEETIRQMQG